MINVLVVGGLWWTTVAGRHLPDAQPGGDGRMSRGWMPERAFWRFLALAWSVTLLGNLIWIAYEGLIGTSLPPLSPVDGLYVARYVLMGLALWRFPSPWPKRRRWELVGLLLGVSVLAWFGHYQDVVAAVLAATTGPVPAADIVGVAVYPVLDAVLVAGGYLRMREMGRDTARNLYHLLTLSFGLYGVANWLNVDIRLGLAGDVVDFASFLWLLSDLVMASAILHYLAWKKSVSATVPSP